MRCRDFLTFALDFLDPVEDRLRSVEDVFCFVLHCTRETLYFNPGQEISCEDHKQILHLLSRRKAGEPLAYILGRVPFYGCDIEVSCDVLIPRQETELLVDLIVKKMEKGSVRNQVVWDIGCGSGCIGIALKKRFSSLCVSGSDLSEKAVEMLKRKSDKCRILINPTLGNIGINDLDKILRFRQVRGGFLRQPNYSYVIDLNDSELKKYGSVSVAEEETLLLVWAVG
ncbi:MAG: methyltransferase, partial [Chlamydiota bacterium]